VNVRTRFPAFPRLPLSCLPLFALATLPPAARAIEVGITSGELLQQTPALGHGVSASEFDGRGPTSRPATANDAPVAGELSFPVEGFSFDGELSTQELARIEPLLAPLRNRTTTLRQLQALCAQLTEALYHDGDALISVLLPAQTVERGVVLFKVVRGHIEQLHVKNGSQLDTDRIEAMLRGHGENMPDLRDIDARARMVGEVPGIGAVSSVLSPGSRQGGTDVVVNVQPGRTGYFAVSADNAGAPEAGAYRVGMLGGVNNLVGLGDRLEMTAYATTPYPLQTEAGRGGRTLLGRVSWDALTGLGVSRAGLAASRVDYRLGGDFRGLGSGIAQVASVYASSPIVRSRNSTLDLSGAFDYKALDDERFGELLENRRHSVVASMRIDGSHAHELGEKQGAVRYGIALSYGATQRTDIDRTVSEDGVSRLGSRPFVKLEPSVVVTQNVLPTLAVSAQLRGQWANGSLDGSERMSLGGPSGVRAYSLSEASVDEGAIVSLSVTKTVMSQPGVAVTAFYDGACGRVRADGNLPGASTTLQGAGVALNVGWKQTQMQLSYAHAIGKPDGNTRNQQVWVTMSQTF
jgi:hemolysin activation/secretion protein